MTRDPRVGVIMGSKSDWETMRHAVETLDALGVPNETRVVSAHRTPDLLFEYAATARDRGIRVIIAGAGGAAHLPGMVSAKTTLPVLGVPVESKALKGIDSLLSIVQMPECRSERSRSERPAQSMPHSSPRQFLEPKTPKCAKHSTRSGRRRLRRYWTNPIQLAPSESRSHGCRAARADARACRQSSWTSNAFSLSRC